MTGRVRCRGCHTVVSYEDRFCEACGMDLRSEPRWVSSTTRGGVCAGCGGAEMDPDGFCENCGRRRTTGADRVELDLAGVGAVTDRGSRRLRNEDAVGIGATGDLRAVIVCDGVASTNRADEAAHAAVDAGIVAVLRELAGGHPEEEAAREAFRQSLRAVAALATRTEGTPPSCTFVLAIARVAGCGAQRASPGGGITVCWVGDSRAYWLAGGEGESRCLTEDDSLARHLARAGIPVGAELGSQGAALVRWLGADAGEVEPHVRRFPTARPGKLVVCSDGLSRYLPGRAGLARLEGLALGTRSAVRSARELTHFALGSGGQDNVTAVVVDVL